MYELIIKDYINKLTEKDIIELSNKKNIILTDDEVKILYLYAKNYWRVFYKEDPTYLIEELRLQLKPLTFNKLYKIYQEYKNKY